MEKTFVDFIYSFHLFTHYIIHTQKLFMSVTVNNYVFGTFYPFKAPSNSNAGLSIKVLPKLLFDDNQDKNGKEAREETEGKSGRGHRGR